MRWLIDLFTSLAETMNSFFVTTDPNESKDVPQDEDGKPIIDPFVGDMFVPK